jgi:hypothetical protein
MNSLALDSGRWLQNMTVNFAVSWLPPEFNRHQASGGKRMQVRTDA